MLRRWLAWSWALIVMLITAALVVLDLSDGPVHRYWSQHSFASSVLSGLLVLLLTVLIVDRVTRMRQLRNQSRAIAAQAGDHRRAGGTDSRRHHHRVAVRRGGREAATDELRTYTQMLLVRNARRSALTIPLRADDWASDDETERRGRWER